MSSPINNYDGGGYGFTQQPYAPQTTETSKGDDGFFSSLFDFSFTKFLAVNAIKIVYVLGLIVIALTLLSDSISLLNGTYTTSSSTVFQIGDSLSNDSGTQNSLSPLRLEEKPVTGVNAFFTFLFVLFRAFLSVVMLRVGLEVVQAIARTARAWRRIRQRVDQRAVAF